MTERMVSLKWEVGEIREMNGLCLSGWLKCQMCYKSIHETWGGHGGAAFNLSMSEAEAERSLWVLQNELFYLFYKVSSQTLRLAIEKLSWKKIKVVGSRNYTGNGELIVKLEGRWQVKERWLARNKGLERDIASEYDQNTWYKWMPMSLKPPRFL